MLRFLTKELGKPDAGKPPVRFDEGWEVAGHWPCASQSVASCLLYTSTREGQHLVFIPFYEKGALLARKLAALGGAFSKIAKHPGL